MGSQIAMVEGVWIGRFDDGSGGELANGDMIGMPIRTIWPECHHHIWLDAAEMSHDLRYCLGWISLVQVTIDIIQEVDTTDTKDFGCCEQLGLADLAQRFQAWIFALFTKPATLAPGRSNEVRFDSLCSILREYTTVAQRFIVRMRQY